MTSRERPATGGATLADRPASARPAAPGADRELPSWEDLYRGLPPEQQQELLALAARQGLLYAHQLPPVDPVLLQQRRQFFTQLVAGKAGALAPLACPAVEIQDDGLD